MFPFYRHCPIFFAIVLFLAPASFAEASPPPESHPHVYVTGIGLMLLAGGGAYAYYQNREADRDMAVYRKSAFTGNTTGLRDKVEDHQRLTWAGLAGAALGGILVVVSF